MGIHGDFVETFFNGLQFQLEFFMGLNNAVELRDGFLHELVNYRFALTRCFIVRDCCYPPRLATKPR